MLPMGPTIASPTMGRPSSAEARLPALGQWNDPLGPHGHRYELCSTDGPSSGIDEESECLNPG
jgi:hypothetical protein